MVFWALKVEKMLIFTRREVVKFNFHASLFHNNNFLLFLKMKWTVHSKLLTKIARILYYFDPFMAANKTQFKFFSFSQVEGETFHFMDEPFLKSSISKTIKLIKKIKLPCCMNQKVQSAKKTRKDEKLLENLIPLLLMLLVQTWRYDVQLGGNILGRNRNEK